MMRDGKTFRLAEAGYPGIEAKSPLKADPIVRMYSMTRLIASVTAVILHEQDKFALDDPVARYLPAFTNATVIKKMAMKPVASRQNVRSRSAMSCDTRPNTATATKPRCASSTCAKECATGGRATCFRRK